MKFTRNTLRALALGFLVSALVTAAFGLYFQGGNIQGTNGSSILGGNTTTTTTDQQSQVAALESEKAALESTQNTLNASIASLRDAASKQSSELAALKQASSSDESTASSSEASSSGETTESTATAETAAQTDNTAATAETPAENTTTETAAADSSPNVDTSAAVNGTFTISPGENAEGIAARLEAEGYIANAQDFMDVVDRWNLSTLLIANSYQLNSNMNVNTIAEILTEGAYYWIP